mgnify:CR=1 FL=1
MNKLKTRASNKTTIFNELITGSDWTLTDQDGGAGNIGSVFFVQKNGVVHV